MPFKERMAICTSCEHLTKIKTCKLCGCFMPAKATIPFAACTAGKWQPEEMEEAP